MYRLLKSTVMGFIDDEALSRGAAIALYTVTSLAPVLLIVIAIAGLVFGQEAAQGAVINQLTGLMGKQAAEVLQAALTSASGKSPGILATILGIVTLLATASGVFGEMQAALNRIWKAEPKSGTISRLARARAASIGLVAALGFLLAISLVVSAGLTALGGAINARLPFGEAILSVVNFAVSVALLAVLFAAIYKVLPDRPIAWRDVAVGASSRRCCLPSEKLDRLVPRQQRGWIELWCRRWPHRVVLLGLLFDADISRRRRIHQGLCRQPGARPGTGTRRS